LAAARMIEPIAAPSPNFNERTRPPDMVLLHYTGMKTGGEALARMCDPEARVSAHYMVEEDGRVFTLVPEERRAWHAGQSFWKGQTDINGVSIGIEIVNPGHEWGYRAFPEAQIEALGALLDDIRSRWEIADSRILGHSDVAPARKEDPGELFPWRKLAEAGHGLWVEPRPAPGDPLKKGDEETGVFLLQAALSKLGYDNAPTGVFDEATEKNLIAFQRHWRPETIDGVADGETRARLMAILRIAD
jgi:N-acetylmuramoyl-L-alanine amidase